MPVERLQKVLAAAGVASRRGSEALIADGRVTVDGRIASLGQRVDPATSRIEIDGRPLPGAAGRVYLALHKPAGVTSTVRDRHARTTVLDLVPTALVPEGARPYPVGRLDQDSEGLIVLTNDGEWAEHVLHPRYGLEREYAIAAARPLDEGQLAALAHGIDLDEGLARLAQPLRLATSTETRRLDDLLDMAAPGLTWYRAVLAQGWKRQLRRMFGAVGVPIERLVRVRIGPLRIDGLAAGRSRRLTDPEVARLASAPGRDPNRSPARRRVSSGR